MTVKDPKIPVYTIKPEGGNGREKRVHRNNIMNCNSILHKDKTQEKKKVNSLKTVKKDVQKRDEKLDDSDSDDENVIVIERHDTFENKGEGNIVKQNSEDLEIFPETSEVDIIPETVNDDEEDDKNLVVENSEEVETIPEVLYDEEDIASTEEEEDIEFTEEESSNEEKLGSDDKDQEEQPRRSQRTRERTTILTYDEIGNPTVSNR